MRRLTFDLRRGFQVERHDIDWKDLWASGRAVPDPVHAGVSVSQDSALRLSVVWRCIRLISETLAGLPADAVRKRGDIREPVERPPAWLSVPNPESTWFEFCERIFESLCMDGNAFLLITARDGMGFPSELWVLQPRRIQIRRRDTTRRIYFLVDGQTEYNRYGPDNPLGEVLHIRLATAGGLRGLSPIEAAKQAIGLGLVTEKTGARLFGKGMQSQYVIGLPADQPARSKEHIALMRAEFEESHGGSDASWRPMVATGGASISRLTITPEEAQFLQTRAFQVEDIASRVYGIPPHLVGLTEKQTSWGTGIEQQSIGFYRFTLRGYIIRFEHAMSQLLPRGQFLQLEPKALLEADAKTEADVLQTELQNGVINFNYWRALKNLPPRPGGDRYMVPLNMQILVNGRPPEPEPAPAVSPNGNGQQPAEVSQ